MLSRARISHMAAFSIWAAIWLDVGTPLLKARQKKVSERSRLWGARRLECLFVTRSRRLKRGWPELNPDLMIPHVLNVNPKHTARIQNDTRWTSVSICFLPRRVRYWVPPLCSAWPRSFPTVRADRKKFRKDPTSSASSWTTCNPWGRSTTPTSSTSRILYSNRSACPESRSSNQDLPSYSR